jgi:FKBP-type peptidyl-prolyl cis-trans isomerase
VKTSHGIEYKIFHDEHPGASVKVGDYLQMHIAQYIETDKGDSLLNDTRIKEVEPIIEQLNPSMPEEYKKMLTEMKVNDSLVFKQLVDSMFAGNEQYMPPFMKKGKHFTTTVKLLRIFKNQEEIETYQKEMAVPIIRNNYKTLDDYFQKNNIDKSQIDTTTLGVLMLIKTPGTGNIIDTNNVVKVNYTGKLINGTVFDSNVGGDKNREPLPVNLTSNPALGGQLIPGWIDAIKYMRMGTKATIYIPSPLGYGNKQMGKDIKPNSILIFDMEIVDVKNRTQAEAEYKQKMEERQARQQKFLDSLKNLQPKTQP